MRLLVIDGNSIANRAFFGIKLLTTKDGRYTNAIFGFLNIMLSLLKESQPDEVAVAFDLKAPTFRHKMYEGYKATRHGMPDELAQQMPVLKEILTDLGYRIVTAEGWEADDILGTLAAACAARQDDCFLATGDRDSLQLVSDTTTVLLATTALGRSKTVTMDVDAIREKYGIEPKQLIEVKSLMGDASDNIPGVRGIGEKTALSLVQNFGSLEGVYEHIDDKRIKPKQREHLLECRELAQLSHTLGTIRTDAPIDTAEGAYAIGEGNKPKAVRMLQELEIHSLIQRFGLGGIVPANLEEETANLPEAEIAPLSLTPAGHYLVASRPPVMGKQGVHNVVLQPESWYAVQGTTVYPLEDAELVRLLDDPDVTLDVFNSAPLYAKAMAAGGWGSSIVWDGKLAAYLLDASASKYQVGELVPSYKAAAAFTCTDYPDAGRLADLFAKMKAEITACGEDPLYNEIEFPLAQVLADMTRIGMLVDRDGIDQFGVKLRSELEQVLTRIHMETGSASFNPNSTKQLGEMLFVTMGLPHGKKTQRGWSTDAETLEALRDYPLVEDILQYRAYQKLNSTYVEGLLKVIGEDGRIHTTFNQTEARTGRLSSDNPNLQNIPIRTELGSQLRAYFIAKPGCVLVDADYSQIELRILAHVTGDEHMQQAFRSGQDIHRSTAARIYGIPQGEVTPRVRSGAKAINFGIMYGKGAYSLSKDIGVTVKEADAFLKNYLAAFPSVSSYMDKTIADARANGYVSTLFGRRRALPELNSNSHNIRASGERMARNTPIQGTAADVIKLAMVRVWKRLRDEKMESRLILTVHDELIVEAPEAEAEKAAQILREEMEGCVHYAVPLSTDVHTGKNWLEAH
ncbi:DNA polymerase I [Faecalibacterium langellae]|uniref:DNA polymerase I n=1 Tax=Faecalibacterium langellae TaxID=3435293 RepID=A0ACC9CZD3_9FIRM|nr:DNA polymerase I [Faecalibacterium prausnitzii]PDX61136.1 DNA polymerase I [Faecalibacterium prausnitzii]